MQILEEPRLVSETENVELIRTFLIGTKENEAQWKISKENGHQIAQKFIGKDFYIIPERIFKPLEEGRGGHTQEGSFESELAEIKKNSHGVIQKLYGPLSYDDGTDDYYYDAGVKLSNSKAASVLLENGSKTWTKFAVSPHLWRTRGPDDNILDAEAMGLALVIKGAYGDDAVVRKYCSGGAVKCNESLAASIQDVITSLESKTNALNISMSAQQVEQVSAQPTVTEIKAPVQETAKVVEQVKEVYQPKVEGITISSEEYEAYKKEREEHKQLVLENKTSKLNGMFSSVSDASEKEKLVEKYIDENVNLLSRFLNDIKPHIENSVKSAEQVAAEANKSKTANQPSSLRQEPKVEKKEENSKTAAVEATANDLFRELFS